MHPSVFDNPDKVEVFFSGCPNRRFFFFFFFFFSRLSEHLKKKNNCGGRVDDIR